MWLAMYVFIVFYTAVYLGQMVVKLQSVKASRTVIPKKYKLELQQQELAKY